MKSSFNNIKRIKFLILKIAFFTHLLKTRPELKAFRVYFTNMNKKTFLNLFLVAFWCVLTLIFNFFYHRLLPSFSGWISSPFGAFFTFTHWHEKLMRNLTKREISIHFTSQFLSIMETSKRHSLRSRASVNAQFDPLDFLH